jgi:chromosomal replication initiation ATPase DnaA
MNCPHCKKEIVLPKTRSSLHEMLVLTAGEYGLSPYEIIIRNKTSKLVRARRAFAVWARQAGYSLPEIGRAMARHHTTVLSLLRMGR